MDQFFLEYTPAYKLAEGKSTPVSVRIGRPEMTQHGDYQTHVEITWDTEKTEKAEIVGFDSLQSLGLAVNFARQRILDSTEMENGELLNEDGGSELVLFGFSEA